MTKTTQAAQTTSETATQTAAQTVEPRERRGRGRRRVGRWVRPVYPIKALYDQASEEERRQAHALSATILEYWTGVATKQEVARRLAVPPIRVWQISQRAAAGLVCGLLRPPSGRRGPPMQTSKGEAELKKENARLEKENALLRSLIAVLREMPANRDRKEEAPAPPRTETTKEAGAQKPRRMKSRSERGSLPPSAGVDTQPPAPPR